MPNTLPSIKNVLVLEGNIGAGKSTFLRILSKSLDVDIIHEPTDKWQKVGAGGNLLELFYKDTPRWAYTFQSYAFISRVHALQESENLPSSNAVQILERSVYCDRYCFAKNAFESGFMTELEWQIYKEWFNWLVEKYTTKPGGFIYLKVSPQVCYQRLVKRNRSEESSVSLDYLEALHRKHEDWLINKKELGSFIKNVPVLVLECDEDFEQIQKEQQKHLESVKSFIEKIKNDVISNPACLTKTSVQQQIM